MSNTIDNHVASIQERIVAAAQRAGRSPDEVTLIAVTKTHPAETIAQVIAAGVHHIGENRIQEVEHKQASDPTLRHTATWHLIGHLQRNKAKKACELFDYVHSLDSVRLAETLNRQGQTATTSGTGNTPKLPVLLQVNVSGEASKEGFSLAGGVENSAGMTQFREEVAAILALPHLRVDGLMTIAPFTADRAQVRVVFRWLRVLRDSLATRFPAARWETLSMGMSDDFEVAIEEGATMVRLGRALFGERG
jgi:pyridoxal phosphate enzyme (YggS family)